MTSSVEQLVTRMLGPDAACARRRPGAVPERALHAIEATRVERAVPKRRREMAAGRDAARAALAQLGMDDVTIPASRSGAPCWPDAIAGSITHTAELCLAVVAPASAFASLGVDAEPLGAVEPSLWPAITTARELEALRASPPAARALRAAALFCAKEAAYKCQYPVTELLLDFGDLEIQLNGSSGGKDIRADQIMTFDAIYRREAPPFRRGDRIPGRLGCADGHVVAVAMLAGDAGPSASATVSAVRTKGAQ